MVESLPENKVLIHAIHQVSSKSVENIGSQKMNYVTKPKLHYPIQPQRPLLTTLIPHIHQLTIQRYREGMQVGSHLDCAGNHLNTRMSTVKGFVNEAHLTGVEDTPSGKNDRLGDSEG